MDKEFVIDLKSIRVLPFLMMVVFSVYASLDFTAVDMPMQSYGTLGLTLFASLFAIFLIVRQGHIDRFNLMAFLLLALVAVVSVVNNVDWKNWLWCSFAAILLLFLFNYYRNVPHVLLLGASLGFSLSIYIGFFQIITHPEMWMISDEKELTGYLLGGNYNQMGCRMLAALITNIVCLKFSRWMWLNLVPLIVCVLSILFFVQSMTAMSCIILFLLLCCIPHCQLHRIAISAILVLAILFEIFVCFNGKGFENNELATWFIVDVLGKDITFTYRTDMWDSALRIIVSSPIWGYGYPSAEWYFSNMSSFAIGPHNAILAILIFGGGMALFLCISIYVMGLARLLQHKDKMANIVFAAITTLTVMMLMEVYPIYFIIYFLVLAYYYQDINAYFRKESTA